MQKLEAEKLLEKYTQGLCTSEEKALVESGFLNDFGNSSETISNEEILIAINKIKFNLNNHVKGRQTKIWPRIAAAASIILCLSFGGYILLNKHKSKLIVQAQKIDIAPGGNKAILTLSNGQNISLTDAKNGNIAQQSGTQIKKAQNGQVVYLVNGRGINLAKSTEVAYNTISTPRGGKWQLTLPDGSRVWLNAESSISFPTAFTGNKRMVTVTGEAYFEVVHNASHPFKVNVQGQTIEDIGTHFNINAYTNESATKITLLEGSVKVTTDKRSQIIKPGQQASLRNGNINIEDIDANQSIAWKDNNFDFDGEDIQYIMRMVERWYNVEVVYDGYISHEKFFGGVSRYENVSEVLKTLETTKKIHFKIEERKIFVLK